MMFRGRVDGQPKARPVLFWMQGFSGTRKILVSGIFGTATARKWEQKLSPSVRNGLTKECVVRLDDTRYINADDVLRVLGSLNETEFKAVRDLMIRYSGDYKANSPDDFGDGTFDIFSAD
ncbi:MAG: hypothetical protein LBL73_01775 [Synergistaceae bacterium]|nr:hypothetical protein [Synergistaceae bacterium]